MERHASPSSVVTCACAWRAARSPRSSLWAGVLTLVFGVVNYLTLPGESPWSWATNLVFGPLFVAAGAGRSGATSSPRASRPPSGPSAASCSS